MNWKEAVRFGCGLIGDGYLRGDQRAQPFTMTITTRQPELALLKYEPFPSEQTPCFSHMLVCSTAPLEAERPFRLALTQPDFRADFDNNAQNFAQLRTHLSEYFQRQQSNGKSQRVRVVVRIHGYNVPLKSVREEYKQAERKFRDDACRLTESPPNDYVLFLHYAWPSERIGAGGPLRWIRAMPMGLWLLFALGSLLAFLAAGWLAAIGQLCLGIGITLMLLRMVTYFRDRERASTFGVFDAVEMVRALHHLVKEIIPDRSYLSDLQSGKEPRISLSFLGHSMGTFLTTMLIRVLTNVFDPEADSHLWSANAQSGPFGGPSCPPSFEEQANERQREQLAQIGDLFSLDRLILVAADIPVWTITTGRSNYLASCLRRFRQTFLFVNDADMVLRLASTLANYFVFPSGTRIGGYRLGNLSIKGRTRRQGYGKRVGDLSDLELHGALGTQSLCDNRTFRCQRWIGYPLNVIDCTDYDDGGRYLSAFTARNAVQRFFNYAATLMAMLAGSLKLSTIDGHGGYFQGKFCMNLLYELALYGDGHSEQPLVGTDDKLRQHQISWIAIPSHQPGFD